MSGLAISAIAVLNFRLLPPLQHQLIIIIVFLLSWVSSWSRLGLEGYCLGLNLDSHRIGLGLGFALTVLVLVRPDQDSSRHLMIDETIFFHKNNYLKL